VFTTVTLLTCYQTARSVRSCVRLFCWAEKRPFPRLRTLDDVAVGQPFLLNFRQFCKMLTSPPLRPDPYPSALQPNAQPHTIQCPFYPVPPPAALSHRKPPSAGHSMRVALLRTEIQDSELSCDRVNTSWYAVWWLQCFTL